MIQYIYICDFILSLTEFITAIATLSACDPLSLQTWHFAQFWQALQSLKNCQFGQIVNPARPIFCQVLEKRIWICVILRDRLQKSYHTPFSFLHPFSPLCFSQCFSLIDSFQFPKPQILGSS